MSRTAAALAVRSLEEVGVRHTFGIPGVHTTELYDELDRSDQITPHLVTSEFCGGFMADAMSRIGGSIGCLVLVPAAGLTHAMSGIGEAYLDGIPMLVVTGGVRQENGRRFQLHEIDQVEVARGITKGAFRVTSHAQVVDTIRRAHRLAVSGKPGPVLIEIPVDLLINAGDPGPAPSESWERALPADPLPQQLDKIVEFLDSAERPTLYLGWGARGAGERLVELAERLQAPVTTTLQGLGVYPHVDPWHAGFGFGPAATPAGRAAFAGHDAMLAIGVRFAEIATGSYSIDAPTGLVHVDIDRSVFDANYPAKFTVEGDAARVVDLLLERLAQHAPRSEVTERIARDKAAYRADFAAHSSGDRVNPAVFFDAMRRVAAQDALVTLDDGNHTFLAAELWQVGRGGDVISPTDFNAMGYSVPAGVSVALARPDREVWSIVGDGCFRMSGYELATATALGAGLVAVVFNDGDLAQIAQAQTLPYNAKTCTVLPDLALAGVAQACGAEYLSVDATSDLDAELSRARDLAAQGRPVVVDVRIDYSRQSTFTGSIIKANFGRFPFRDKVRMVSRAVTRRLP